ncbi:hypothetical protein HaLaN_09559, partial [Haematococcus lacustris]
MVRSPLAQILGKGADRPAALALLLLSLLGLLSPSFSTSPQEQHLAGVRGGSAPYGPHAPPRRPPFFQGWYTRVTAPGLAFAVVLGQHIPGSLTLTVTSQPGPAAALPWSPSSAAPESWVSGLGALVALHYATLSLATQVEWSLELPGPQPQPQPAA